MLNAIKPAVILGVGVTLLSALIMATGMHARPSLAQPIFLGAAIGINVAVIIWALRGNADKNGYGAQLGISALIGLVAGVVIFIGSYVLTTVVFPDALSEAADAMLPLLEQSGMPEEQIEGRMTLMESPVANAAPGLIGTFVTSLVVGAVVAIFFRRK
ncbi:hypothetical protein ABI59_08805 [Acidobacteria bacterium Mor1]|nr:hypothetical protein ABI59_08805 [Acidobacteria bacterium Mor1]